MKKIIDLHLHSNVSDGSLSPSELMEEAARAGASTVSLTDHDTVAGIAEAAETAKALGIEFIPGIELSCTTRYGQMDMLGYYIPLDDEYFNTRLAELRAARNRRNSAILGKLSGLNMPIYMEEVAAGGESSVGRPHIALAMLKKGYVSSVREAFDRFLGADKPAFVPQEEFTPEEAAGLLSGRGAVPVIAHPLLVRAPWEWLASTTASLVEHGLAGLEAYHSEHDARGVRNIVRLADLHDLIVTGGSDFHGAAKPTISVGRGKGSLAVPETVLNALAARHEIIRSKV